MKRGFFQVINEAAQIATQKRVEIVQKTPRVVDRIVAFTFAQCIAQLCRLTLEIGRQQQPVQQSRKMAGLTALIRVSISPLGDCRGFIEQCRELRDPLHLIAAITPAFAQMFERELLRRGQLQLRDQGLE